MNKFEELRSEIKLVFAERGVGILDALVPLLIFTLADQIFSLTIAILLSASTAFGILLWRLMRKQSFQFALGGLGTALLAALLVYIGGTSGGFYLPGFITNGLTVGACFISVSLYRPLAAYSSHLTRRWPLEWYWHQHVRPAYSEVSIFWGFAFSLRLALELIFFFRGRFDILGSIRVLMGWPYTILILIVSYLYGQKRLHKLKGPGVEEFRSGAEPPWRGQQRGF